MRALTAGFTYFAIVFGAGFVLGTIRQLWVAPAIGERWAELLETPLMLFLSYLAARWTVRRFSIPSRPRSLRIGMGLTALALLVLAEVGFVLQLRGLSLSEYLATRDPVSGSVYALSLVIFAAIPSLIAGD